MMGKVSARVTATTSPYRAPVDGEDDDNGDGDGEGNVLGAVFLPSVSLVARFPAARSSLVQTCR